MSGEYWNYEKEEPEDLPEPNFYEADYPTYPKWTCPHCGEEMVGKDYFIKRHLDVCEMAAIDEPHYIEDCPNLTRCPAHCDQSAVGKMLNRFFLPWKRENDN